jgi:acetyl esterase/lipase
MNAHPPDTRPQRVPEAETGHIARKTFDLPYVRPPQGGTPSRNGALSAAQKLDIYWPAAGDGPFPVIVSVHGGAFRFGDKRDPQVEPMLNGLERGYAVVSINYRMSGEATFPALVHDLKAAIRWVRAHAAEYMMDPGRIAVWGGSAGGYLALMAGVSVGVPELDDPSLGNAEHSSAVQAVVSWFPPTDFLLMDAQLEASGFPQTPESAHSAPESPESLLLGRQITEIPDRVRAANPETYIRPGLPPFFIQHGTADDTVPYQQSLNFACQVAEVEPDQMTYELLLNARHADPAFESPQNVKKVLDFLDRALG